MTTTATPPSPYLALALRRESTWREAQAYSGRVKGMTAAGMLSREAAAVAEAEVTQHYRELCRVLELACVTSPGLARAAGLSVWVDPVAGVGVEVGDDEIERRPDGRWF